MINARQNIGAGSITWNVIIRSGLVWLLIMCKTDGARDNTGKEGGDQIIMEILRDMYFSLL